MERMIIKPINKQFPVAYEVTLDGETRRYVPERTAERVRVPRHSHVALGHYECGACHTTVGPQDNYCRSCGAELFDHSISQ